MVFQNRNYYPMSWSDLDVKVEFCTDQVYPFSYIDNRCVKDAWVTLGSAPTYGDFSTGTRGKEKVALTIEQSPDVTAAVLKQVYCNLYGNVGAFPCAGMPETAYAYTALLRTVGTVEGQVRSRPALARVVAPPLRGRAVPHPRHRHRHRHRQPTDPLPTQGRYHDFGTLDVSPPATPVFMA